MKQVRMELINTNHISPLLKHAVTSHEIASIFSNLQHIIFK